ncbi:flagellar hook-associated protein FlgK [Thermodesulfobacteriota bacterium]
MTIGIFGALHITKQGLFTQQAGVGVTAHNLSNVNTEGYSRQSAVITTMDAQMIGGIVFGSGAQLETITKSYDKFLNNNIIFEKSILGQWEARETYLAQAEVIFNDSNEMGLNAILNEFWGAWEDLSNHPEGIAERAVLQTKGESMAGTIKNMISRLESVQNDANLRIQNYVVQINSLSKEIAELNGQIVGTEISNANANDLTDRRSLQLEELSKLIDITVLEDLDGQLTVLTATGKPLVSSNLSWELGVSISEEYNNNYAIQHVQGSAIADITDQINRGEIKGLLEIRDEVIPAYIDNMNRLAATLITEVNKIHHQGYGIDGSTGNYFFDPGEAVLEDNRDNTGGGLIYDYQIENTADMQASDYEMRFTSSSPVRVEYELYDTRNNQYVYSIDAGNNTIIFNDTAGGLGADSILAMTAGSYNGEDLAAELEAQLEAQSATSQNYNVTYSESARTFTITNNGAEGLTIRWNNTNTNAAEMLGFSDAAATTITSNNGITSTIDPGTYDYFDNLYLIRSGLNDQLDFDDGGGAATATISAGYYSGAELAAEIESQLELSGSGADFTVAYDPSALGFQITHDGNGGGGGSLLDLNWSTSGVSVTLGFDLTDTNNIAAGVYDTSDNRVGIPVYLERTFTVTAANNGIVYNDSGTGGYVTASLTEGNYTGEELAAEIEKRIESTVGASGQDYIVNFDVQRGLFNIINATGNMHSVDFDWTASTAASLMGYTAVATAPVTVGGNMTSNSYSGNFTEYKKIDLYGVSAKITSDSGVPARGDIFSILQIQDAAKKMRMDPTTVSNTEKIAAAQGVDQLIAFDIDGSNNTLVFDDDGSIADGITYTAELTNGRYTADELADELERALEESGSGQSYFVSYDTSNNRFSIANNPTNTNEIVLMWEHADSNAGYTLGYNDRIYSINQGSNDQLVFTEDLTAYTATLTEGSYTGEQMAAEIEDQLEANGTGLYDVTYDGAMRAFTIINNSNNTTDLNLAWSTSNAAPTLGFSLINSPTLTPGGTDTSDYVPERLLVGQTRVSDFDAGGVEVGDNRNALDLANLKNITVLEDKTQTIDSFYSIMVGSIGTDVEQTNNTVESQGFVIEQFVQRRESIAGVSLDEEMVNLIKFQQAYIANTKMIATLDNMLSEILNIR